MINIDKESNESDYDCQINLKKEEELKKYNDIIERTFSKNEELQILEKQDIQLNNIIDNYKEQFEKEKNSDMFINSIQFQEYENIDDDKLLVYNTLKNILKDISKHLDDVDNLEDKKRNLNRIAMQFQCVCHKPKHTFYTIQQFFFLFLVIHLYFNFLLKFLLL